MTAFLGGARRAALAYSDPVAYVGAGYNLKRNPEVPLSSLDIRQRLAALAARTFVKRISRYQVDAKLEVAAGDEVGVNLIKGNAYDAAINHLENLSKPLSLDDTYNLALAYESLGEYNQAVIYYQQGLDQEAGDQRFIDGLKRVKR